MAILQFISAGVWLLVGVICLFIPEHFAGLVISLLVLTLSVLNFFCGYGLWKLKRYGRTIQLIFSWVGLIGFPIGTIISTLILIFLYRPQVKLLFSEKPRTDLTMAEVSLLADLAKGDSGIVVAIALMLVFVMIGGIGIVAAIAIPNLLNAIDRGKQKRTMYEIRVIASAVESYSIDMAHYPISPVLSSIESLDPVTIGIQPRYVILAPLKDGWGGLYYYQSDPNGASYQIRSFGKDRRMGIESEGRTQDFDCDIIFRDGVFTAYPEGLQT